MREKANTVLLLLEPPGFCRLLRPPTPLPPDPAPPPRTLPLPTWPLEPGSLVGGGRDSDWKVLGGEEEEIEGGRAPRPRRAWLRAGLGKRDLAAAS